MSALSLGQGAPILQTQCKVLLCLAPAAAALFACEGACLWVVLAAASWVCRGGKSAHPDMGLRAVQVPARLLSAGTVTAEEIYLQAGKAVTVGLKDVFIHETPEEPRTAA